MVYSSVPLVFTCMLVLIPCSLVLLSTFICFTYLMITGNPDCLSRLLHALSLFSDNLWAKSCIIQGVKLIFFSDSHLAPKFFKVLANSKKVAIFIDSQNLLFTLSSFEIKLGKRYLMRYKEDTRMYDMQCSSPPKSKMASSYQLRCMCCVLETNLTRKFAVDLSLQIFLIH